MERADDGLPLRNGQIPSPVEALDATFGSASDNPSSDPLATHLPSRPDPHGDLKRHLACSRDAVAPLHVSDYLAGRPSRQSGIASTHRADQQRYHRERARSRGHEALTPGLDVELTLLPVVHNRDGRWALVPGAFVTTSAEVLYSPSYSLVEKHLWTYLLNNRCFKTFQASGQVVVHSVRLGDVAASAGVSSKAISRALARLVAKGRLSRVRRGNGKTNVYTLATFESGASVYPAGHPRSARKRLETLVARATQDRRSVEARFVQTTLGFAIDGLSAEDLLGRLWRRLDRLADGTSDPCPRHAHAHNDDPHAASDDAR